MSWQELIVGNSVLVALVVVATRAVARQKQAFGAGFVVSSAQSIVQYVGVLALIPLAGTVNAQALSRYWPWFIGGGLAFAASHVFMYKLLSFLDAGISSLLGTMGVIFAVLFAALILHEDLTALQAIGGLVLFFAIAYAVLISTSVRHHSGRKAWAWGLLFAFFGGLSYGLAIVNEKFLLGKVGVPSYLFFGWGFQVLASILIAARSFRREIKVFKSLSIVYLVLIAGLARSLSGYMFNLAEVRSGNVAIATVSSNIRLILVILIAALLLKEHQKLPQKLAAAVVAVAGLSLILWK